MRDQRIRGIGRIAPESMIAITIPTKTQMTAFRWKDLTKTSRLNVGAVVSLYLRGEFRAIQRSDGAEFDRGSRAFKDQAAIEERQRGACC
jgi:hypothetical protein